MNRYTLVKLIFAACAVAAGAAYLWLGEAALVFVLPLMWLCFTAIAFLAVLEARKSGGRGVLVIFTALAAGLVSFFAFIGMLAYFASL